MELPGSNEINLLSMAPIISPQLYLFIYKSRHAFVRVLFLLARLQHASTHHHEVRHLLRGRPAGWLRCEFGSWLNQREGWRQSRERSRPPMARESCRLSETGGRAGPQSLTITF